jgi:RNase H-fold protein (predicted Holliday junction resolvase)
VKVVAIDYGSARTGVAVSDPSGTIARPLGVVERAATDAGLRRLAELIQAEQAERVVVGLPLTLRGEHGAAEQLAREAVEIAEATDMLQATGDTYLYLAEVLRLAGRTEEAVDSLEVALALFERKGVLPLIELTRASLLELDQ